MKRILILFITLIIGFGAFAKSDYKEPVESDKVAELVIQPTKYREVKRDMYVAVDRYDNYFISINVNYFVKKGKDALEVTFANGDTATLELDKSIKVKAYSYFPTNPTFRVTTTATTIGNYTTATTTVTREKYDYYEFFSIYPITKEQYENIRENGIKEIRVEGTYSIIIQ